MTGPKRGNPAGQGWVSGGAGVGRLPTDHSEVAARLQRRLSAFHLTMHVVQRDAGTLLGAALTLASGYPLTDSDRRELYAIAGRMLDAAEVLR